MIRCSDFVAALTAGLLLAAASGPAQADGTLDRIKRDGVVRIGITDSYPTSFRKADGSVDGEEYELAARFFDSLGVHRIEATVLEWSGVIPALKARRIDVVVATLYIKPERCPQVAFTRPDIMVNNFLIVRKGNPKKIHSFADVVKDPTLTVAAIQGGGSALTVKRSGIPAAQTHLVPGYVDMIGELTSGRVDAIAMDDMSASHLMNTDPDTVERPEPFEDLLIDGKPLRNFAALGLRPEDKDLLAAADTFLDGFVGSPDHLAILAKFHIGASAVPPHEVTAAQLCQP